MTQEIFFSILITAFCFTVWATCQSLLPKWNDEDTAQKLEKLFPIIVSGFTFIVIALFNRESLAGLTYTTLFQSKSTVPLFLLAIIGLSIGYILTPKLYALRPENSVYVTILITIFMTIFSFLENGVNIKQMLGIILGIAGLVLMNWEKLRN